MAKRNVGRDTEHPTTEDGSTQLTPGAIVSMKTAEERALDFAEDLGRLLGTAEKKAQEWLSQRQTVTKQLTDLRDKATQLLRQLGAEGAAGRRGRRAGRATGSAADALGTGSGATRGTRKRRKMTAAQRKAVGERMKKYWAARRRAEKSA